jgi:hypothetical protein
MNTIFTTSTGRQTFMPLKPRLMHKGDSYTIYATVFHFFRHIIVVIHQDKDYSIGFVNGQDENLTLVSPDPAYIDNPADIIGYDVLTKEQADKINMLLQDFTMGGFLKNGGMYAIDNKKRQFGIFMNNCTSMWVNIFPSMLDHLSCTRKIFHKMMSGTRKKRRVKKYV